MSSSTKKPPKRFQFIDNNNVTSAGQNSTQVRRHVMQEYMREKRWKARARADSNDESKVPVRSRKEKVTLQPRSRQRQSRNQSDGRCDIPSTAVAPPSRASFQESDRWRNWSSETDEDVPDHLPEQRGKDRLRRSGFYLDTTAFAKLSDVMQDQQEPAAEVLSLLPWIGRSCGSRLCAARCPRPQSLLSAARTDPFDSLPVTLNYEDEQLFDFYATVMPACSYGVEKPHAQNWFLSVFIPEAMSGAVCFENTILTHAATTRDRLRGAGETRSTTERRIRASQRLLDHHRQFPSDTSNATISATVSAAALEFLDPSTERRKYGWMHWSMALQKICERGGPSALVQHKRVRMLINWYDYVLPGYYPYSAVLRFNYQCSALDTGGTEALAIARAEVSEQCTEFITFLKCTEQLALVQAGMQRNPISRNRQPIRYSIFLPGQPLHTLLAHADGPRYTESCQYEQTMCRLAALMTINITIWEYRHSPELSEQFFLELVENVAHNGLARHASVEALLQILLGGSRYSSLQHTERPWFIGRMLRIAKRLSRRSFDRLNDLLFVFIRLGSDLQPTIESWQNELRGEILSSPLVSCYSRFTLETT